VAGTTTCSPGVRFPVTCTMLELSSNSPTVTGTSRRVLPAPTTSTAYPPEDCATSAATGTASAPGTLSAVMYTVTGASSRLPAADGSVSFTVTGIVALLPVPEATVPTEEIVPGVVSPSGSVTDTASPTATSDSSDVSSAMLTTCWSEVAEKIGPDAGPPRLASTLVTRTAVGSNTTDPSGSDPDGLEIPSADCRSALADQAERADLERARRAVLEGRARIAQELHDVVAHHMSLIVVRAETAPYRLADLPDPVRAEFGWLSGSAREAMADMRRLLTMLRSDQSVARAPQPGLPDLPELIDTARQAGMAVELSAPGGFGLVPESAGLCAYRIVQEALSNAGRHASGAAVTVAVDHDAEAVMLQVASGPGAARAPRVNGHAPGHGLAGMRERAELLGGSLTAGTPPAVTPAPAALDVLTSRETEVLKLIAQGLSNSEISDALNIAEQTTKTHVSRVLAKLGLRDRAQAVMAAYESGLVTPGG
jgi:signal transduction histidine kinase/DNA-binding CsgD family transcriptional regulator